MTAPKLFITALAILSIAGCKKDHVDPAVTFNGYYGGKITYSNTSPAVDYTPISGNITISFSDKSFFATSPLNTLAAGSRGSFAFDTKQVSFSDSTVHTANFDWGLILSGSYTYSTKGDSLFLTKKIGTSIYSYKLLKASGIIAQ